MAMVTHTPATELMKLDILRFDRMYEATARVLEKRKDVQK